MFWVIELVELLWHTLDPKENGSMPVDVMLTLNNG